MQQEYKELWGYKIYPDGKILGIRNTELKFKNKTDLLKLKLDNEYVYIPIMRFIYYAFNPDFDYKEYSIMVIQKENNDNLGIDNLMLEQRGKQIQGENSWNAKLTDKQVEEIIEKYKRSKEKDTLKNNPYTKVSYRSLAEEYGVSHSLISGIIKRRFRNNENYKLK